MKIRSVWARTSKRSSGRRVFPRNSKEDLLADIRLLEMAYPEKSNMVDPVTKLFNRRYFDIILAREIARSERYGQAFSVLLIDIDDFHRFNEQNNVSAGDEALCEIARLLKTDLELKRWGQPGWLKNSGLL
jgi:GGDEF domain-containing protein